VPAISTAQTDYQPIVAWFVAAETGVPRALAPSAARLATWQPP